MQSKQASIVESFANIAIGFGVAVSAQYVIFPWFDIEVPVRDHLLIGLFFTVVSLVRSYTIRRLFNRRTG
jgi:hypothetical protein